MNEPVIRLSRPGDEKALSEIWGEAFGDREWFISLFMDELYSPGMASVAEVEGRVVSAIYLFRGTALVMPDGKAKLCPYCYTLGTLKEFRGHGLGAAVSEHIMHDAMLSSPMVALLPAEKSLYGWYSATFGLEPFTAARRGVFSPSELEPRPGGRVHRVDADSYGRLRELLLAGHCHARFSPELLRWYDKYIRHDGGGLYLLDLDGAVGCAACEAEGAGLSVKELLLPHGDEGAALALLNAEFRPEGLITALSPMFFPGTGEMRDFAVARWEDSLALPEKETVWWGLAFD